MKFCILISTHLFRDCFQIVRQSDFGHGVDKHGREVCPVVTKFGRFVVPGEDVVVVVPSFTGSSDSNSKVFGRVDGSVIGKMKII